jgi:hypothetical protein
MGHLVCTNPIQVIRMGWDEMLDLGNFDRIDTSTQGLGWRNISLHFIVLYYSQIGKNKVVISDLINRQEEASCQKTIFLFAPIRNILYGLEIYLCDLE